MKDKSQINPSKFNDNKFESLIENGMDCVIIVSESFETKFVSRSVTKILGYSLEEAENMNILDFGHPDDIENAHKTFAQVMQNPGVPIKGYLSRVKHKNGDWIWVEAVITNWLHDPSINGIVDNFRDVTDRVLAEEKANTLNERLKLATQIAKVGIWEYHFDNDELLWNDVMYQLYDIKKESFPCNFSSWLKVIHPDDRKRVRDQGFKVIDDHKPFEIEFRIIKPDNTVHYIKSIGKILLNTEGQIIRSIGTNWDITSQKNTEDELRRKNKLLNIAERITMIGNWLLNVTTDKVKWSNNLYHIFDIEKNIPLVFDSYFTLVHPEDVEKVTEHFATSIENKDFKDFIHRIQLKDGTVKTIELLAEIICDEENNVVELIGTCQDVTTRKKTEALLQKMATLKAQNEDMEQLAYITSHDLREPLLTMKKYSEVLHKQFNSSLGEDGKILLETIIRSANRMEVKIKDLLDFSQLGQIKELEQVNSNVLINSVLEDLESLIEANNAGIIMTDLPSQLKAYPTELQLIFQNLINNAIKFSKKDTPPIIHISSHKIPEGYEFKVKDNGIGIHQKDFKKIFAFFQRLHNVADYEGSGIGLAQVKKLVEKHNGHIHVESELGKGTTFTFSIITEKL